MCEMLKPNREGYSAKRRERIVLLPAPLGPLMTIGVVAESAAAAGFVGAMVWEEDVYGRGVRGLGMVGCRER